MGKTTGFLEYDRKNNSAQAPLERIRHWNEFHPMLDEKERCMQGARCMACGVPFCQSGENYGGRFAGCPLHNLIPEWNDLICSGNFSHAVKRLKKTNNFPEFTGRVCPALCEAVCSCAIHGDAVTVKENELFTIEHAYANGDIVPTPPAHRSGKSVAVVGSGPSGLAAADQLNHRGHSVTVYERSDRLGGLLMYGIPNMKLEKRFIDRRIAIMEAEGVKFITNCDIGRDLSAAELLEKYDAVVLCCGSSKVREYRVAGEATGVCYATEYLTAATKTLLDGTPNPIMDAKGKNVVVIGAGDTSCDCVATAIRQGCKSITQLIRRTADFYAPAEKAWPDIPHGNSDYGDEEAVALFGRSPKQYGTVAKELIADENGALKQLKTIRLTWSRGENGRLISKEIPGTEDVIDAELVLVASGFAGCEEYVCEAFGVDRDKRENASTPPCSYQTANSKVFVAGDMHRGQSLVVWAIAEGRAAATEIDRYLMHYTNPV
ncbi:MAG: glutamate synthase subunit beta [Oscillospiraceae bacterium]